MGKVRRLYHQKYRAEWEKFPSFEHWLERANDGVSAHCKICDTNILTRLASIKQHHATRKHQEGLKCNEFMTKHLVKIEMEDQNPPYVAVAPKPKYVAKAKRIKQEPKKKWLSSVKNEESCSNDSILDDLLSDDEYIARDVEYLTEAPREVVADTKVDEVNEDALEEDHNIINEFDLFGKSVSLQLNHMELEDALMCQERLQTVLTEVRLKILKRQRESKSMI